MRTTPITFATLTFIISSHVNAATILLAETSSSFSVYDRLVGLGNSVTVSNASTWDANFDYSAYDVVAFQYGSRDPFDITNFLGAVDSNQVGTVFFRGDGAQSTANALGLISGTTTGDLYWQTPTELNVLDNTHYITSGLDLGVHLLGYTYMSSIPNPGADTTVLGTGTDAAALVAHNSRRAVITPFYGHFDNYDSETQIGLDITQRSIDWAAGAATVPVPAAAWLFGSGLLGLIGMARPRKAFSRKT